MQKRQQVKVIIKSLDAVRTQKGKDGKQYPVIDVTPADVVGVSENLLFRGGHLIHDVEVVNAVGETVIEKYALMITLNESKAKGEDKDEEAPKLVIENGVVVQFVKDEEGNTLQDVFGMERVWMLTAARSSSQRRQGSTSLVPRSLYKKSREILSYGWDARAKKRNEEVKSVANVESWIGNNLASSISGGFGFTDLNISDYTGQISVENSVAGVTDEKGNRSLVDFGKHTFEKTGSYMIDHDFTDGQAMGSPVAFARIARNIGVISKNQHKLVMAGFKQGLSWKEQTVDAVLGPIWGKIPSGIQFRYGLKKGFMTLEDHGYLNEKTGQLFDFVFPEGAAKAEVKRIEHYLEDGAVLTKDHGEGKGDHEVEFSVLAVSKKKLKGWARLNYQFIATMPADFENDIMLLAIDAIRRIMKSLENIEEARAFLGMVASKEEDDKFEEQNEVQLVREFIDGHKDSLGFKWVENKIKKLMRKSIQNMKRGQIPVEDANFAYVVADTNVLMKDGQPLLPKGTVYFGGKTGMLTGQRSPKTHMSESIVAEAITSPELEEAYGHYGEGIIVLNTYDDWFPRAGGMDTDGDKIFVSFNPILVGLAQKALEYAPGLVYGELDSQKLPKVVMDDTYESKVTEYDAFTMKGSLVGAITDRITSAQDMMNEPGIDPGKKHSIFLDTTEGRLNQGDIIDDAKKGTSTPISKNLGKEKYPVPSWLKPGNPEARESESPMGQLSLWIDHIALPAFDAKFNESDTISLVQDLKGIDVDEVNSIYPEIKKKDREYRLEVQRWTQKYYDEKGNLIDGYTEEQADQAFSEIIERNQLLLTGVNASAMSIGAAALISGDEYERKGGQESIASYPFIVATDYTLAALSQSKDNFRLGRIAGIEEKPESDVVKVVDGKVLDGNDVVGTAKFADGEYDVIQTGRGIFLRVPFQKEHVAPEVAQAEVPVRFNLVGFQYAGLEKDSALNAIKNGETLHVESIREGNNLRYILVVNGKRVGTLSGDNKLEGMKIDGRKLEVVNAEPLKGKAINVVAMAHLAEEVAPAYVVPEQEVPADMDFHREAPPEVYGDDFDMTIGM